MKQIINKIKNEDATKDLPEKNSHRTDQGVQ